MALTIVASGIIGLDRGERGRAAGLRTTILVGLAASVAMIQANILLSIGGKTADSFGVMDLMRLPLGILTGVGFIGGGAILRRDDLVTGVTTAATLWIVTVIGLCLGGGQLVLGTASTLLAFITLRMLRWLEERIPREHFALLVVNSECGSSAASELPELVEKNGYKATFRSLNPGLDPEHVKLWFELSWRQSESTSNPMKILKAVEQNYEVISFELTPKF
ncbi:MAG TPA: MgtC/SapB family protein [Candidatus Binataceae bacterium]|nr:MgtC/SapB family protein [Candidatus Binataceae bacterium]